MTFFGTDRDVAQVWRWLFDVPRMKIFEDHSVPDKPNRWFHSWSEISDILQSHSHSLTAWPESVGGEPRAEQITFTVEAQRRFGAKGRTVLTSPALVSINCNHKQNGCLASTSISSWTEKGARQRSTFSQESLNEIDWKQFRSLVNRIERLIAKTSPAKMRSYPVMPDAFERYRNNEIMLWNWGEACIHPSPLVEPTKSALKPMRT